MTQNERIARLPERCWSAASKLESVCNRDPDAPPAYRAIAAEAFNSLRTLDDLTKGQDGPWRLGGMTEDGRMHRLLNAHGHEVARVYGEGAALALVAVSHLFRHAMPPEDLG